MSDVLNKKIVLALNHAHQPIGIETVRKAVEDMTSLSIYGEAPKLGLDLTFSPDGTLEWYQAVDWEQWIKLPVREDDLSISTRNGEIRAPTVIVCATFTRMPVRTPTLNSGSIFERDGYRCMYCGKKFPRSKLNLDHIIPASRGGRLTWTNTVCSCIECNSKKADRTPGEAGMKLLRRPVAPKSTPISFAFKDALHPHWAPFLN